MYPVSARWQSAIRQSHTVIVRADLYPPFGPPLIGMAITGGSVAVDATAAIRRSLSVTVADPEGVIAPFDASASAAPYGAYIIPWRGIRYSDGTDELVPQGVFRISSAELTDDGAPALSITGYDKSYAGGRDKFVDPYVIAAGQVYSDAIATLEATINPGGVQIITATTQVTPLIVIDVQEDPWQHLTDMAASYGAECFYDPDGAFVLQASHDPTDDLVSVVYASGDDAMRLTATDGSTTDLTAAPVLLDTDRTLSDNPGFNGVVMVAESTTLAAPIRTALWDLDPTSPTYSEGPYGRVPGFQSSPFITSQASCDLAAAAWLKKNIGGTEELTFEIVPNAALDAADVVRVIRSQSNLDRVGVVTQLTVPLTVADSMSVTFRSRQPLVSVSDDGT